VGSTLDEFSMSSSAECNQFGNIFQSPEIEGKTRQTETTKWQLTKQNHKNKAKRKQKEMAREK